MSLHVRHIKGYNAKLGDSVHVQTDNDSRTIWASHKCLVVMENDDPTKQIQLRSHDDVITAIATGNKSSLAATGQRGKNCDVVVWDLNKLAPRFRFEEHDKDICALDFSHDDRLLATVDADRDAKLFIVDTSTGKVVAKSTLTQAKRTTAMAWSPKQEPCYYFATASETDVHLWSVDPYKGWLTGERVTAGSIKRTITSLVFSADGAWLFAGTGSGDIITINVLRRSMQLMQPVAGGAIGGLLLTPDTKQLLVGSADGSLALVPLGEAGPTPAPPVVLGTLPGSISSLAAKRSCPGSYIVGTSHGHIYKVQVGGVPGATGRAGPQLLLSAPQAPLLGLAFARDDPRAVATCCQDGTVAVWDVATCVPETLIRDSKAGAAHCVALGPDHVISGWEDGTLRCHARGTPAPGRQLWAVPNAHMQAHSCGVTAVTTSHRGHFVASGGAGGELRVWDASSREMAAHMKHHTQAITDIKVLRDDVHLLAACEDRSWTIWDLHQEKLRSLFKGDMGAVRGLAVHPDQVTVVSCGMDRAIHLWDLRSGQAVRNIMDAHSSEVSCITLNSRGTLIASGGADSTVKLWDLASGTCKGTFAGHSAGVTRLEFSPDDNHVVSVGKDAACVFWRVC